MMRQAIGSPVRCTRRFHYNRKQRREGDFRNGLQKQWFMNEAARRQLERWKKADAKVAQRQRKAARQRYHLLARSRGSSVVIDEFAGIYA